MKTDGQKGALDGDQEYIDFATAPFVYDSVLSLSIIYVCIRQYLIERINKRFPFFLVLKFL